MRIQLDESYHIEDYSHGVMLVHTYIGKDKQGNPAEQSEQWYPKNVRQAIRSYIDKVGRWHDRNRSP